MIRALSTIKPKFRHKFNPVGFRWDAVGTSFSFSIPQLTPAASVMQFYAVSDTHSPAYPAPLAIKTGHARTMISADTQQQKPVSLPYARLKQRKDFLSAARGVRCHTHYFTLQISSESDTQRPSRFGLTVTKKTAPLSVHRNRIRRRIREALRLGAASDAASGHDYVIVARESVLTVPFSQLKNEISRALSKRQQARRPKNRQSKP